MPDPDVLGGMPASQHPRDRPPASSTHRLVSVATAAGLRQLFGCCSAIVAAADAQEQQVAVVAGIACQPVPLPSKDLPERWVA